MYFAGWWAYSIARNDNELTAYLSLYTAASAPTPLAFLLLDKPPNRPPIPQFMLDLLVFTMLFLAVKFVAQSVELWELMILSLIYSMMICVLAKSIRGDRK
jgi:hypothetical protein